MTDTLAENQKDQNLLPIPILESSSAEPNMHLWLTEAKKDSLAPFVGMYLTHNGVVRATPKRIVRPESSTNNASEVEEESRKVVAVDFTYDKQKLAQALQEACAVLSAEKTPVKQFCLKTSLPSSPNEALRLQASSITVIPILI